MTVQEVAVMAWREGAREAFEQESTVQVRGISKKPDFKAACAYLDVEMGTVIQETVWEGRCFLKHKDMIEGDSEVFMMIQDADGFVADWLSRQPENWKISASIELEAGIRFYMDHIRRGLAGGMGYEENIDYAKVCLALAEWRAHKVPKGERNVSPGDMGAPIGSTEYVRGLRGYGEYTEAEQEAHLKKQEAYEKAHPDPEN